jgi:P4 family phage/plasmid primase-like protien
MDDRLIKFLTSLEVGKDQPFTHTSKIKPLRRYYIEGEKLEKFYQVYNQVITEGCIAGITEKPNAVVPLIVDIDFKCTLNNGLQRYYKPKHIREIIQIYHEIIEEIAEEPTEKMFYCCVLEKTEPVSYQGYCKDGFHLHFPYFYTQHWVQKEYIRNQVIQRVLERKIFADIPIAESIEKVFDRNIPNVTWLMYGSRKEPKAEAYKITKFYNKDLEFLPIKTVFKKYARNNVNQENSGKREWNLPRYMSIRNTPNGEPIEETPLKKEILENKPKTGTFKIQRKKEYKRDLDEIFTDLDDARYILEQLIDQERASDYGKWMEIGWILFNICEGHQKGLDLWIAFSSRCPEKFQEGVCEKEWSKMEVRNYSLATLKWLGKNDSPNEYNSWKNSKVNHFLEQGLSQSHNDIAKILYIMYENEYICADIEKDVWYKFKGHRWIKSAKGIDLRWHLSHELSNKYSELISRYMQERQLTEDLTEKQSYDTKAANILKLIQKLKNSTFKNCVMKEALEYFYKKDFVEKMDENPNLLVCENGVYDTENKIFRDGRPDDYCTKSTGLYYHDFEEDDPRVIELNEVFKKVFVNPKLLKFFRQTVSDLVRGGNRHKIFIIWTGVGDNGKSVCADLLEKALGDYYYTPPTTLLTGKQQQSSGATAELLPCKGARAVVLSETDNADVLNCGTMKKLTGGDPFYARGVFKEPTKITPQFKLVLHCNKLPNVSAEDKASWNRIRVLPFESKFVKICDAPKSISEQNNLKIFPMDKGLKARIDSLAEPFLWWLIKAFEEIGDSDLFEPPEVIAATDVYHKTNDFYMQFIDERIQYTGDVKDFITVTLIYTLFKEWYKDSYPGSKIPSRMMVKESLEKKLGTQAKGVWRGYTTFDPDSIIHGDDDDKA